MASFLRRPFTRFQHLHSSRVCSTRFSSSSYSSDALVEIKPREVGMVSGISRNTFVAESLFIHPRELQLNKALERWENPLIRWTSTGDPLSYVGEAGLSFDSVEAAKTFSEKHGWEYTVKKFHAPLLKV